MAGKTKSLSQALSDRGGNRAFLKDWKKAGEIVVFLHANSPVAERLKHVIPYVDKDDKGNPKISFLNFVCLEDPEQYDPENPIACPIEMFASMLIADESIADDTVVWEASIGGKYDRIVSKADFIGEGDWKNSFRPRHECVLAVIDAEHPDKGIQLDTEAYGLLMALQQCVDKEIKSMGEELGHPGVTPYAFRFIYDESAAPAKKYDVAPYRRAEVTPAIAKLLSSPAVSFDSMLKTKNLAKLRQIMEASIQIPVDLNLIFGAAREDSDDSTEFDPKKLESEKPKVRGRKSSPLEETKTEAPKKSNKAKVKTKVEPEPEPEPEETEPTGDVCETCGGTGTIGKKKNPCPDCDGTGRIETKPSAETVECDVCNGTGTIGKKKTQCPECGGTGQVEAESEAETEDAAAEEPEMIECETCNGTGSLGKGKKKSECPDCGGTGQVEAEEAQQCWQCEKLVPLEAESCPFCKAEFA